MSRLYGRDARDYARWASGLRRAANDGPPAPYQPTPPLEALRIMREMRSEFADEFEADLRARGLLAA